MLLSSRLNAIAELPAFEKYPELAAKLAELMPLKEIEIKAVMASRRASIDDGDINARLNCPTTRWHRMNNITGSDWHEPPP